MTNQDGQRSVLVTGEERAHPAVRLLARACIALAQEQLAAQQADAAEVTVGPAEKPAGADDVTAKNRRRSGVEQDNDHRG